MIGTYKSWEMPNTRQRPHRKNWKDHYPRGYVTKEMMWDNSDAESPPRVGVQELMRQRHHHNLQTIERGGIVTHAYTHLLNGADQIKLDDLHTPDDNTDLNSSTSNHGLLRKLDNDATHFLNGAGAWATPFATCRKTSDQNFSTATLGDVSEMLLSVTSGVTYYFAFYIIWQSTATTEGIKLGLTTPTYTRYVSKVEVMHGSASSGSSWDDVLQTSGDSTTATTANQGPDLDLFAEVRGIIVPSADGTLQLRGASEFAAPQTATLRSGSCGMLMPIP